MEQVQKILKEIEKKHEIKILHACETGSRGWGFPSPDSDFDIRFIYMHHRDWYLMLNEQKDSIEIMDGDFDVTGWDIRKCLMLLKRSNAALIERFQSPIEYFADIEFKEKFNEVIRSYYSPKAVFHHHYSLAKGFFEELGGSKTVKLKGYMYMIRSLLSCYWIVNDSSVLPMNIERLMKKISDEDRERLRKLIELKSTVGEKYLYEVDKELDGWIKEMWVLIEKDIDSIPVNNNDFKLLNKFFLSRIKNGFDN